MFDIERRIGPDIKATISVIVKQSSQGSAARSAIATYTQGDVEHIATISLGDQHNFNVGDPIKITPTWKHITGKGVWSTEFSSAQDQS